MQFRLLGPLEVLRDGVAVQPTSAKQRLLLAVLLVHANEVVAVDTLVEALWGDRPPATATGALQNYVSHLRKAIEPGPTNVGGPQVLLTAEPGYRLAVGPGDIDAATFERLLAEGRAALREGRAAAGAELLREALGLWRGPALSDVADERPIRNEARRLDALRILATEERIEADMALGRHGELVAELDGLVAVHALQERLWGQLMLCLYRVGRQADALGAYQRLRHRLADELGLEPSPDLARLEHDILTHDPRLDWSPPVARPARRQPGRESNLPTVREPRLFVGRTAEMDALRHWWRDPEGTGPRLSLLIGESGVGKTQLASAFAREVEDEGAQVLYGRAVEAGGSSYEPVLGALRQFVLSADDGLIDAFAETATGALTRLLPEMAERRPAIAAKASAWGDVDRSWLLGAVADCMAGSDERPTLMVLDDLQWADRPALLLLSRLVEPGRRVRILGTYRAAAPASSTYLADFLADLRRSEQPVLRVVLGGLTVEDVNDLLTTFAGTALSPDGRTFASDLHRRTDGHPFFLREMLHHLDDTGAISPAEGRWASTRALIELGIPDGVLDVLGQRLSHLRPATRDALRAAAVVGPEFDVDVLAAVQDEGEKDVVGALEEALASGIVLEDPASFDRYGFVHAIVHEMLLGELSRSRRARLEWRTGEALETLHAGELDKRAGEVARHFTEGAAVGGAGKAVEWSLKAGAGAMDRLAYEEAVSCYEMALGALVRSKGASDGARADVLIALGQAANRAGDPERWRGSCLEAASLARRAGDADRLAHAALSLLGTLAQGPTDESVVGLMEEAIDALRASPASSARQALLAELLARLGGYLTNTQPDRSSALAAEALDTARRAGEPRSLALALIYSTQAHTLEHEAHNARLQEAALLAEEAQDLDLALAATSNLMASALMWVDRDGFDQGLAHFALTAGAAGAPVPLVLSAIDHAGAAALDGRYDDARLLFRDALVRAAPLGDPNLRGNIAAGMVPVDRELGRMAQRVPAYRRHVSEEPSLLHRRAGLVRALSEAGQRDEATERLEAVLAQPSVLLSGFLRRYSLAQLAEAAEILDHTDAAAQLAGWLEVEPRRGAGVIVGPHAYFGAVRRYLGLVALTLRRASDAVSHHEAALEVHERMRARGWAARSRYDLARALVARGEFGDMPRAARLLDEAVGSARELGMPRLLEEVQATQSGLQLPAERRERDVTGA